MKKALGLVGAALLVAAPAMAQEGTQPFNCDFQPSCEVAPGINYAKMSAPTKSKFNVTLGGYVKLDYAYNSEFLGTANALSPGSGAMPVNSSVAGRQSQSMLSASQSRLFVKVDGPTLLGAKTSALVEGDFLGIEGSPALQESPTFRLRLAYGTLDWANTQVLFGQSWDMFAPMIASTQDFRSGAPFGAPNVPRIPQIRVTQKFNLNPDNQFRVALAVQDPAQYGDNTSAATGAYGPNLNYNGQISFVSQSLGKAPGYFGMSMNPLTLTFFGQYGSEKAGSNFNHHIDTWGYGLYAFVPVLKSKNGMDRTMTMSLEAQTYMAANMAYNSATSQTVLNQGNAIGAAPVAGTTEQIPAQDWAATAQVIFYPTQNLGITGGWGGRYAYNSNNTWTNSGLANYQRYTQEIYANVAYDFNAAVRLAAEYQNFKTAYGNVAAVGTNTGVDNTFRVCAYYFF